MTNTKIRYRFNFYWYRLFQMICHNGCGCFATLVYRVNSLTICTNCLTSSRLPAIKIRNRQCNGGSCTSAPNYRHKMTANTTEIHCILYKHNEFKPIFQFSKKMKSSQNTYFYPIFFNVRAKLHRIFTCK